MVGDGKAGGDRAGMVKGRARELGCDLCGIAPIDRSGDMPDISNPAKILPEARSVIAFRVLAGAARAGSRVPYAIVRNGLSGKIDEATIGLSCFPEDLGYLALPTGAIEPRNHDRGLGKAMGLISLRNAACQAGLGTVGKNTLLLNDQRGRLPARFRRRGSGEAGARPGSTRMSYGAEGGIEGYAIGCTSRELKARPRLRFSWPSPWLAFSGESLSFRQRDIKEEP